MTSPWVQGKVVGTPSAEGRPLGAAEPQVEPSPQQAWTPRASERENFPQTTEAKKKIIIILRFKRQCHRYFPTPGHFWGIFKDKKLGITELKTGCLIKMATTLTWHCFHKFPLQTMNGELGGVYFMLVRETCIQETENFFLLQRKYTATAALNYVFTCSVICSKQQGNYIWLQPHSGWHFSHLY